MRLFAVREIADQEAVGFFWANDLLELAVMVDSMLDPGLCEYKPITKPTAIMFGDGGVSRPSLGWKMGVKAPWYDDDDEGVEVEARFEQVVECTRFDGPIADWGDNMWDFLYGGKDITGWKPLGNDELVQQYYADGNRDPKVIAAIREKLGLPERPE